MIFRKSTFSFFLFAGLVLFAVNGFSQIDPLTLNVNSGMGSTGTQVCLDVTATNFVDVESIQFNLSYNATLVVPECPASYVHPLMANNIFGDIFACNNKDNGYVNFVWASDPTTIPDGEIIFTICFNLIGNPGNKSPVYFNGLILDVEVVKEGKTFDYIVSNAGTIMITSNSLQVFYNKCDADGVNMLNNASLTFYAAGGTPPYTYTVTPGPYNGTITIEGKRETLKNIPETTYNILITDALGNTVNSGPIVVSNSLPITYDTPVVKAPTCVGRRNGSIDLPNPDGITPLLYEWSNFLSGTSYNTISSLNPGKYTVTITDFNGCQKVDSFELKLDTLKSNLQIDQNATCADVKNGRITVTGTGGTPFATGQPYEYWLNNNNGVRFTPPFTISNLGAGRHTVFIKDAVGCTTRRDTVIIGVDRVLQMSAVIKDLTCHGSEDGEVYLTASPTTTDYTFIPFTGFPDLGTIKTDTFSAGGLKAGNYGYRISDSSGCRDTLFFTIREPDTLVINPAVVQPDCSGPGSITLGPSGGTGAYDYVWSPAAGNVNSLTNLNGGTYSVTVSDANNCSATQSFTLNTGGTLNISVVSNNISCPGVNDGRATVQVLFPGQIQMFEVFWRNSAGTELPVKTTTISNLAPGTYSVEVVAADGCKSEKKNFVIADAGPISFTASVSNAKCQGEVGSIVINITGGQTGFAFAWKDNTGLVLPDTDNRIDAIAGQYMVTVSNPSGCSKDSMFTITEPASITFPTPTTRNPTCFGRTDGQAAIMGGNPNLTFIWSNGASGIFALNYPSGPAWVYARDNNACKSDTIFFTIGQYPILSINEDETQVINPVCFGDNNGSVTIEARGGTGTGYKYRWQDGTQGPTLTNIPAGPYVVTITDSNNCEQKDTFYLTQPDKLEAYLDKTRTVELDCNNLDKGKIAFLTTGGNPGVKAISWQSGVISDNGIAVGLSAGTYCATVSDNFGCKDTICHTLISPPVLRGELNTPESPLCNGGTTCISVRFLTGGTGNKYTFQINNGTRYPIDTCITVYAGQYFVNLIDSAGCSIDTIITITQPDPISVDAGEDQTVQLGLPSSVINATVNSPAGIDTLVWTPITGITCLNADCTSIEVSPSETTTYQLAVTDANGCQGFDEVTVTVKDTRNVFFPNIFTPNRDGFNDFFQVVTGPGVEKILSMSVFDRWGNEVFNKNDFLPDPAGSDGWDGTFGGRRLDPGVFVYYARALFIDGKVIEYSGSVTLADKVKN